jgi:alpha-tubulin suppressor-like RCC1 family protein
MRRAPRSLLVVCSLSALACDPDVTGIPQGVAPALEILDGAHLGETHFFFLPPIVPQPVFAGVTDAALSPEVRVCEWDGIACGAVVAAFSMTDGTASEVIRYDAVAEHYLVNWHTDRCAWGACALDPDQDYRLRVLVGSLELGHADVDVVSSGRELRNVQTNEYIGLLNGRTLPVKFRIEQGIVGGVTVSPSAATIDARATQPFTATATDLHGEELTGLTTIWSSSDLGVAEIDGAGLATGVSAGEATITASIGGRQGAAHLLVVDPALEFAMISGGNEYSCGITTDGAAYCWGSNSYGQLGDGTNTNRLIPTAVVGGHTFTHIDAGLNHTCAVTSAGDAYCWGQNETGTLGIGVAGFTEHRNVPTAVLGDHTFTQISAGNVHTCALATSGAAYCWGQGLSGQLGRGVFESRLSPVAVGGNHTFTTIASGNAQVCGITTAGSALCWGLNSHGQVGDGTFTNRNSPTPVRGGLTFATLGLGDAHSCGVTTAGAGYCWGSNDPGQLGLGFISAPLPEPQAVSGGFTLASITGGGAFTCATTSAGTGLCWGYGANGQRGDGTATITASPTPVIGGRVFAQLNAGGAHACGVTVDGEGYCWGGAPISLGRLGNGSGSGSNVPVRVAEPE